MQARASLVFFSHVSSVKGRNTLIVCGCTWCDRIAERASDLLHLASKERISCTPSVECILGWTAYKMLLFCSGPNILLTERLPGSPPPMHILERAWERGYCWVLPPSLASFPVYTHTQSGNVTRLCHYHSCVQEGSESESWVGMHPNMSLIQLSIDWISRIAISILNWLALGVCGEKFQLALAYLEKTFLLIRKLLTTFQLEPYFHIWRRSKANCRRVE